MTPQDSDQPGVDVFVGHDVDGDSSFPGRRRG